jgi:hypothetical protein
MEVEVQNRPRGLGRLHTSSSTERHLQCPSPSPHSGALFCHRSDWLGLSPKGRLLHSSMRPVAVRCGFDLLLPDAISHSSYSLLLTQIELHLTSALQPSALSPGRRFPAVVPQLAHPSLSSLNVVPPPTFTFPVATHHF